ncbi:hypothetical protein F5Y16DRAFT_388051 [Xylariaceae sp. FL0255]|nr:hypothetical protein F5Y16DRAFT_388051 [Xylariaceae sp. FL0255]
MFRAALEGKWAVWNNTSTIKGFTMGRYGGVKVERTDHSAIIKTVRLFCSQSAGDGDLCMYSHAMKYTSCWSTLLMGWTFHNRCWRAMRLARSPLITLLIVRALFRGRSTEHETAIAETASMETQDRSIKKAHYHSHDMPVPALRICGEICNVSDIAMIRQSYQALANPNLHCRGDAQQVRALSRRVSGMVHFIHQQFRRGKYLRWFWP